MARLSVSPKTAHIIRQPEEIRIEQERMRDVLILLQHLVQQEEVTIRLILDCLYDIGAVNLINQKFRVRPVNKLMKWIARLSKPAFRVVAMRWFKKKSPQLIANWLQSKVRFRTPEAERQVAEAALEVAEGKLPLALMESDKSKQDSSEVLYLRSRIKTLTVLLIGVTIMFSSTIVWLTMRG
jgi:hypothetical protein